MLCYTLTLVFGISDQFSDHGLYYADVTVQKTSQYAASQRHPEVGRKSNEEERDAGAETS